MGTNERPWDEDHRSGTPGGAERTAVLPRRRPGASPPQPDQDLDAEPALSGPLPSFEDDPSASLPTGTFDLAPPPVPARSTEDSAAFATGALHLGGGLIAPIKDARVSLDTFAHLDDSEDPELAVRPATVTRPGDEPVRAEAPASSERPAARPAPPAEPTFPPPPAPLLRPSQSSAPLRQPDEPIPLTPLFGGKRETVTAATVGFDFVTEEQPPVARRPSVPWLNRPVPELDTSEPDTRPGRLSPRKRLALVGIAAAVLPTVGIVAVSRVGASPAESVEAASAPEAVPEVDSVSHSVYRPTVPPTTIGSGATAESEPAGPGPGPAVPEATPAPSGLPPIATAATSVPQPTPPTEAARPSSTATRPPTTQQPTTRPSSPAGGNRQQRAPSGQVVEFRRMTDVTQEELEFLTCTMRIESRFNYQAEDQSHRFYGAYQFEQKTWDGLAEQMGWHELVGVRPDRAAPADQNDMALALYRREDAAPWNGRCD
jgi:hypothetical protein